MQREMQSCASRRCESDPSALAVVDDAIAVNAAPQARRAAAVPRDKDLQRVCVVDGSLPPNAELHDFDPIPLARDRRIVVGLDWLVRAVRPERYVYEGRLPATDT